MSLIEAQAANVAVVSTNVGGVEDILCKDKSGYVIDNLEYGGLCRKTITVN